MLNFTLLKEQEKNSMKSFLVKGIHPKGYYTIERVIQFYDEVKLYTQELNGMGLTVEVTLC